MQQQSIPDKPWMKNKIIPSSSDEVVQASVLSERRGDQLTAAGEQASKGEESRPADRPSKRNNNNRKRRSQETRDGEEQETERKGKRKREKKEWEGGGGQNHEDKSLK